MKKRSLISAPITSEDIHSFAQGYRSERQTKAVRIAWNLENEAVRRGWPVGQSLGSETDLMECFGVNRNRMREVFRILEARGAMRMQRGRHGGLRLLNPDIDHACHAFSIYLRARGYSGVDASDAMPIVDAMLAELPQTSCFVKVFHRTRELLLCETSENSKVPVRSIAIAAELIEHNVAPLPIQGVFIGSEDALSNRFHASRATTREMLQILNDVGVLRVKRGRGGGYSLERPAAIGAIRQLFVLFAADHVSAVDIIRAMWVMNLVQLHLAMRRLQCMDATVRDSVSADLALTADTEPRRWATLQIKIAKIAKDEMVGTLQECLAAYLGRLELPRVDYRRLDNELVPIEAAIVKAVKCGDSSTAERHQRAAHTLFLGALDRVSSVTSDNLAHLTRS